MFALRDVRRRPDESGGLRARIDLDFSRDAREIAAHSAKIRF